MGWIVQRGTRITESGIESFADVARVVENPGKHIWITLAHSDGSPKRFSSGAVCRMALPDHKKQIVYKSRREAAGDAQVKAHTS